MDGRAELGREVHERALDLRGELVRRRADRVEVREHLVRERVRAAREAGRGVARALDEHGLLPERGELLARERVEAVAQAARERERALVLVRLLAVERGRGGGRGRVRGRARGRELADVCLEIVHEWREALGRGKKERVS